MQRMSRMKSNNCVIKFEAEKNIEAKKKNSCFE